MAKKVIVFDIDGTVANIEHRQHFVKTKPKNWPAFNRGIPNDLLHVDIAWLFNVLADREETVMLFASGRGEEDRAKTEDWLRKHGFVFEKLYMRPAKDSRPDNIVKGEILEQIRAEFGEPFMVFDDRNSVVDMWRANGVRCLQVAPGAF